MIIESIMLKNFLSHTDSTVDFTGSNLWLICGQNGAGKSALFDAVEYALYGQHRGGNQQHKLLVKHGTQRAVVEVTITLDGRRYRVRHILDAKDGNRQGEIEQWQADTGAWRKLNIGGESNKAVWDWLRPYIPSHDLFRSGIFLKQGATAHVFSGNAGDRTKRFAELLDLGRYSDLSRRALERGVEAHGKVAEARTSLSNLGDVSDAALDRLEADLQAACEKVVVTEAGLERAVKVREGAENWARLQDQMQRLREQCEQVDKLLQNEARIRDDDRLVREWDRSAGDLDRYWREHSRAMKRETDAQQALHNSSMLTQLIQDKRDAHSLLEERHNVVAQIELPASIAEQAEVSRRVNDLKLELQITKAHADMDAIEREVAQLADTEREQEAWRERKDALPYLDALARAKSEAREAERVCESAQRALSPAAQDVEQAEQEYARTESALHEVESERDESKTKSEELRQQIAWLNGRVAQHGTLQGDERECPVCAQTLDDNAHVHVKRLLESDQAALAQLNSELALMHSRQQQLEGLLKTARTDLEQARTRHNNAKERRTKAQLDLDHAREQIQKAGHALDEAVRNLLQRHPRYSPQIDAITRDWIDAERKKTDTGLRMAEQQVKALHQAQRKLSGIQSRLETLRHQRAVQADPAGDWEPVDVLHSKLNAIQKQLEQSDQKVQELQTEKESLQTQSARLTAEIAGLVAEEKAARERATEAQADARQARDEAEKIAVALRPVWTNELADQAIYNATRRNREERRMNANRLRDLEQAYGKRAMIEKTIAECRMEMDEVAQEFRISTVAGQTQEQQARNAAADAIAVKARLENELGNLVEHRRLAVQYKETIDRQMQESDTYRELAEILNEGGPLQTRIAEQEQEAIIHEVNAVLQLLGDSLKVTLGDSRRQRQIQIREILIVDGSDPVGKPRYFEYLSGGEQFRIALALALALHRRVAHGNAGTLIVDEGFGALDENRRDELAHQMTDMSHGILQLGLAKNILICSHNFEVQRHFPYRWLIDKQDGSAHVTVIRPDEDIT